MDGSAVCVYMEGSRPILCELQSLVTFSRLPSPRRTSGTVIRFVMSHGVGCGCGDVVTLRAISYCFS